MATNYNCGDSVRFHGDLPDEYKQYKPHTFVVTGILLDEDPLYFLTGISDGVKGENVMCVESKFIRRA